MAIERIIDERRKPQPTPELIKALNLIQKDEWLANSRILGETAWQDIGAAQEAAIEELAAQTEE